MNYETNDQIGDSDGCNPVSVSISISIVENNLFFWIGMIQRRDSFSYDDDIDDDDTVR